MLTASSLAVRDAPKSIFIHVNKARRRLPGPFLRQTRTHPAATWLARGISLPALYSLTCTIRPRDVEVTAIQAFFEICERFPVDFILSQDVQDTLKTKLLRITKCNRFGAVIKRDLFNAALKDIDLSMYYQRNGVA